MVVTPDVLGMWLGKGGECEMKPRRRIIRPWVWIVLLIVCCAGISLYVVRNELRALWLSHQISSVKGAPEHLAMIERLLFLRGEMKDLGAITEGNLPDTLGIDPANGRKWPHIPYPFIAGQAETSSERLTFEFVVVGRNLVLDFDNRTRRLIAWYTYRPPKTEGSDGEELLY